MQVVQSVADLRAARIALPGTFGLVPTMGALHAGHLALVQRARVENDGVGVSIFVNPTQFNQQQDLSKYPRTPERDLALLAETGVDLVWIPTPEIVYPPGFQTWIEVTEVGRPLEGVHRPGHFRGVATVVAKLFNVFTPDRAYFGQKDAQQVAVIKQMARDLNFDLEIVVCPTVREADGLAMSSRNVYLDPAQRSAAPVLYRALSAASEAYARREHRGECLRAIMQAVLDQEPLAQVDYVSAAHPETLREVEGPAEAMLLSLAVRIGKTRLIDNVLVGTEP